MVRSRSRRSVATDADGDEIVWSLEGDDAGAFTIPGGVLSFKDSPNFEIPTDDRADNIYKVIVKANNGSFTVEITVKDEDEPGSPGLTKRQPQVGRGLDATGTGDPDTPITDVTWQWARSDSAEGPWENIGNPTASTSRNPVVADEGMYLRVTAMYTDRFDSGKTASFVSENPVEPRTTSNARPSFADHDDSNDGENGHPDSPQRGREREGRRGGQADYGPRTTTKF